MVGAAGVPVDLMAGMRDGIIPPENVRMHAARMKEAGVKVRHCMSRAPGEQHRQQVDAEVCLVGPVMLCTLSCARTHARVEEGR